MNAAKVIGIANRLRIAPAHLRQSVIQELLAAIDEDPPVEQAVNNLRAMLQWEEVKSNPVAVASIARQLRQLREQQE